MRERAGAPTMLVVTVLYARVEITCAGGRVYRGKKGMDVVGHGCVRGENGGDLLFYLFFLMKKKEKKKKKFGIFSF